MNQPPDAHFLHPPALLEPAVGGPASARGTEKRIVDELDSLTEMVGTAAAEETAKDPVINKLIIQIPCFNEEGTLAITLDALPRRISGVGQVEWLVIDDGSQDRTVQIAREHGVDHIVRLPRNQGLARAFMTGIEEAVRLGADVIVNTDADNQYCAQDIERLVQPIVEGQAEFVVGQRPIQDTAHFSRGKKLLQRVGSWVVRRFSNTSVADAPSGFRAMTRQTAMRLNVFTDYTYTLETIIQAGQKNMAVMSVPIRTNPDLRPSRLLKSIPSYVSRSTMTILRIFMTYRPLHFFGVPSSLAFLTGVVIYLRFAYFYCTGSGAGHVQSLIAGSVLIGVGCAGVTIGLVADLISVNRKLLEKVDWRVQEISDAVRTNRRLIDDATRRAGAERAAIGDERRRD